MTRYAHDPLDDDAGSLSEHVCHLRLVDCPACDGLGCIPFDAPQTRQYGGPRQHGTDYTSSKTCQSCGGSGTSIA